jgi:hypothetical protein
MLRVIGPLLALLLMSTILACSKRDPVATEANDTAGLPPVTEAAPDPTGSPPKVEAASATDPSGTAEGIPASLHGRWGLTPMDCTSTKGDAKGLILIGPAEVRFYESRAVPAQDAQSGTDSISGDFSFTGEGQTWTKFEALELKGHELVRTESNPMASFTYARCK